MQFDVTKWRLDQEQLGGGKFSQGHSRVSLTKSLKFAMGVTLKSCPRPHISYITGQAASFCQKQLKCMINNDKREPSLRLQPHTESYAC